MARFTNPIIFSKHFLVDPEILKIAGLIDPLLTVDTQLFIDPILLDKSSHEIIRKDAYETFRGHIAKVIRLLSISKTENDVAWKSARRLLSLGEAQSNGLGYGISSRSGASRPDELRETILRTAKEIIELGSNDPEMISLMGFFEENVGPDTISDLTTQIIEPQLAILTNQFCTANSIPTKVSPLSPEIPLPHFQVSRNKEKAILLVPYDIVRELPVANDWNGVAGAVSANAVIRDAVNHFLAGILEPTVKERKEAMRKAAMESSEMFETFIAALKENTTYYDPNIDALGYYKLKDILLSKQDQFKSDAKYDVSAGIDEIIRVVNEGLAMFKHHIEKGNLWEALWIDGRPKKERAAQLIFFAIADCFCLVNNIDISPEANMGGGPVDFKYSKGYQARVLVEMKKSSGTVVHGYTKQLEIYKDASRTNYGIFVVLDFGDLGDKLNQILALQAELRGKGEPASEIFVIDATRKASASKRK